MIRIEAFQPSDFAAVVAFVEAIQEHEREQVPELKPGPEIGKEYAEMLMRAVAERNGCMIMARADAAAVGFACAWIEPDDDPLIRDDARIQAYVSDIFVDQDWRRQGIASLLMDELEGRMRLGDARASASAPRRQISLPSPVTQPAAIDRTRSFSRNASTVARRGVVPSLLSCMSLRIEPDTGIIFIGRGWARPP